MQHVHGDVFAEVGAVNEYLEAAPSRFQFLEGRLVQDVIHLFGKQRVQLRQHLVNQLLVDRLLAIAGLEYLGDEDGYTALGDCIAFLTGLKARLRHDLGQQATLRLGFLLFGSGSLRL
ncbi:hypothetical protein D3C80_1095240 [compost metagenome]